VEQQKNGDSRGNSKLGRLIKSSNLSKRGKSIIKEKKKRSKFSEICR
jgi:hypothetical protein